VAWFLREDRRWLATYLDPARYEVEMVGTQLPLRFDQRRTGPAKWLVFLWLALVARWRAFRNPPDLVVSAFPQLGFMVAAVAALTLQRTPHVVWYFNCGHRYTGLRRWLGALVFRFVSRFVVYSTHERGAYASTFALPRERFRFSYLTSETLDREALPDAQSRFGLPRRYVAALGSSGRDYGTLLAALEGLDVELVIVAHPYALAGHELPSWVHPLTSIQQDEYLAVIAQADAVLVPVANRETASGQMTVIQAMTLGVPVVATRCIGTEDYIRPGSNGLLVELGDVAGWREAVRSLLDDPTHREEISEGGARFASRYLTDAAGAELLEDLATELVGAAA
jgi:glycosyltransferase involved in cell wall biosynthesis